MKKSIPIILLLIVGVSALAREIFPWTEAKMQKTSDLIVVGTLAKVQDLDETNSTLWANSKFRGVEATFAVSKVLKGDSTARTVVLHYYRFETGWGRPLNGPCFLNLKPTDTNQFIMYLVRDGASRFAPVSGDLTQIKCYRGWAVDEWTADTLTHIHAFQRLQRRFGIWSVLLP